MGEEAETVWYLDAVADHPRRIVRQATDHQGDRRAGSVVPLHRGELRRLKLGHPLRAVIAAEHLQGDGDAGHAERDGERAPMEKVIAVAQQEERMDGGHGEPRGDIGRERHMDHLVERRRVEHRRQGVDIDNLLISQPDTGEQALEIVEALVRSGAVDVIVIDSVAALTPQAEIEGEMGDAHVGLQARLMSQALRKLTAVISKSNTIAIFIN